MCWIWRRWESLVVFELERDINIDEIGVFCFKNLFFFFLNIIFSIKNMKKGLKLRRFKGFNEKSLTGWTEFWILATNRNFKVNLHLGSIKLSVMLFPEVWVSDSSRELLAPSGTSWLSCPMLEIRNGGCVG